MLFVELTKERNTRPIVRYGMRVFIEDRWISATKAYLFGNNYTGKPLLPGCIDSTSAASRAAFTPLLPARIAALLIPWAASTFVWAALTVPRATLRMNGFGVAQAN